MSTPPVQIRNDEVVRDIRELADLTGQPLTEVVAGAVRSELIRVRRRVAQRPSLRRQAIEEALRRFRQAPIVGEMLDDQDLYDETGLPR